MKEKRVLEFESGKVIELTEEEYQELVRDFTKTEFITMPNLLNPRPFPPVPDPWKPVEPRQDPFYPGWKPTIPYYSCTTTVPPKPKGPENTIISEY